MPRGRPPLDPDAKQQRRAEALKRYSDKNADKLREAARLRMQWHRATIANSGIFTQRKHATKVALASERYRDRKHEEEHAERRTTDAATRKARGLEKDTLHRKHARPKKLPQAKPLPRLPFKRPPHAAKPPGAVSPITLTPAPCCATIRMSCIAQDDSSDAESHNEQEHHPPELPIWPARTSCPQCCPHCYQEDCIGSAPNLILLDIMVDSYPGILLCEPKYAPDPGHEDRYKHPGPFYAVVCKEWRGVVTSKTSRKRMMEQYPHAYTWEASPWWTFDRRWTLDCTEYHEHKGERAVADEPIRPVTPNSGPTVQVALGTMYNITGPDIARILPGY
ncbi:hypothetical protein B0H14DRAFT_3508982 [Mycena olivaceomarginata]|nr:hypothetical protein B0H14DRAFT_3508982 [Mycena olivaceomarginata]